MCRSRRCGDQFAPLCKRIRLEKGRGGLCGRIILLKPTLHKVAVLVESFGEAGLQLLVKEAGYASISLIQRTKLATGDIETVRNVLDGRVGRAPPSTK